MINELDSHDAIAMGVLLAIAFGLSRIGVRRRFSHLPALIVTLLGYLLGFLPGLLLSGGFVVRGELYRRDYGRPPRGHAILVVLLGLGLLLGWSHFQLLQLRSMYLPLPDPGVFRFKPEALVFYSVLGILALVRAIRIGVARFEHGGGGDEVHARLTPLWQDLKAIESTDGVEQVIRASAVLEQALTLLVADREDPAPEYPVLVERSLSRGILRREDARLLQFARTVRNRIAHENHKNSHDIAEAGRVYLSIAGYVLRARSRPPSLPWTELVVVASCLLAVGEMVLCPGTLLPAVVRFWTWVQHRPR